MFNLAPVAIAILDDKLKIHSVNPAYCALTENSAEELIGVDAASIIGAREADQATGHNCALQQDGPRPGKRPPAASSATIERRRPWCRAGGALAERPTEYSY